MNCKFCNKLYKQIGRSTSVCVHKNELIIHDHCFDEISICRNGFEILSSKDQTTLFIKIDE